MHERLLIGNQREDEAKDAVSWLRCTIDSVIVRFRQVFSVMVVHTASNGDCPDVPLRFWFKIFAAFHLLDIVNQCIMTSIKFKGIRSSLTYLSYALILFTGYCIWVAVGVVWYFNSENCEKSKV